MNAVFITAELELHMKAAVEANKVKVEPEKSCAFAIIPTNLCAASTEKSTATNALPNAGKR